MVGIFFKWHYIDFWFYTCHYTVKGILNYFVLSDLTSHYEVMTISTNGLVKL